MSKLEIMTNSQEYFEGKKKELDKRLDTIKLSDGQMEEITTSHTRKVIRDKLLGMFKIGEIASTLISWNEDIDQEIREAKKEEFLAIYFSIVDDHANAIENLKKFIANPQGNTLFNKIQRIIDDSPPDLELTKHLSLVMLEMINSDFIRMFESHRYVLELLDQITPQALTILSDHENWPSFQYNGVIVNGKITSDWTNAFIGPYVRKKGVINQEIITKIKYSTNELIQKEYIIAISIADSKAQIVPTEIGKLIYKYITRT